MEPEQQHLHVHHAHHSDKSHRRMLLLLLPSLAFALTLAVLYRYTVKNNISVMDQVQSAEQEVKQITVGNTQVNAFIAKTPQEQAKGLGERESLNENDGMLFTFNPTPSYAQFWMKGMRFPLDFIWIRDHTVTQIHANVAAPEANTDDAHLPLIIPNDKVDAVLEVNAGFAKNHSINVGDLVVY